VPVLIDFESRSRCDLKKRGGRNYWLDESTEALCAVYYDTDTQEVGAWVPGEPLPECIRWGTLAAHNAMGFDRFAIERVWGRLWSHDVIDTSELARRAGLPGALDALGTRWLGLPKDKAASKFTKGLSRASRAKKTLGQLPEITPAVLERVLAYCASDVEIMAHGWEALAPWLEFEPDVSRVDRAVNDRGIAFDVQLAKRLLECDARNAERALDHAGTALQIEPEELRAIVRSPEQFVARTGVPNAQAETIDALIADGPETDAYFFAVARRALASIASGKLEAGLARVSPDGRLRDSHRYVGAHTWRWSGKGMQLQNMPRPSKRFEEWGDAEICRLADAVLAGKHYADQDEIDLLLRATLHAKRGHTLATCDFTGVEARGLAWAAGDGAAIEALTSGKDAYKIAASAIFGVEYDAVTKAQRQVGKIAELALGYQGGVGALENMARGNGVDLAALGVDPLDTVNAWRDLHWPVVEFWREIENAFASAVRGEEARASVFTCTPSEDGSGVAIWLPSGRPIVYNETRFARQPGRKRPGLAFLGTKNFVEHTYGGKLTENVIQALCRELMAESLVKADDAGLDPVLHVHDEIVSEVPASAADEGLEYLTAIMLDLPEWAEGFPIGAAGHVGRRYRK
jgi:DNA polymerase